MGRQQGSDPVYRQSCTIAASDGLGTAISGVGAVGIAVVVPSAWTAANIGFASSADGETWVPLRTEEGERVVITGIVTNAANQYIAPAECWALGAWPYMRLESLDTADDSAENQGAARTCTVVMLT